MASESISFKTYLSGRQPASAPSVDDVFPTLQGGSEVKKITWEALVTGTANFCEDTGEENALVVNCATNFTALIKGLPFIIEVANTNTGPTTVLLNDILNKPLKKNVSNPLDAGDIVAGQLIMVAFDGVNFQLLSQVVFKPDIYYGVTTGSDNAYVLTFSSPLDAYIEEKPFVFRANFTNTAAATMVIDALDVVALKKNVADPLDAGDILNGKIYIGCYDGTNIQILNPSKVSVDNSVNDFRLTLTSSVPLTTSDVTGATTIYCTPYNGNKIALYNGITWQTITSAEFSLALGELTSGLPYDVFCYSDEGVAKLEFLAWSSGMARATALTRQDGILVKSGDATRRYLGTFYTTSTTTTEDSAAKRYLYNHYHRRERLMSGSFTTNRSTSSTSLTEINSEIRVQYVVGVAEDPVGYKFQGSGYNSYGSYVSTAIADNSTSVALSGKKSTIHAQSVSEISISGKAVPAIGQHFVTLLGAVETNSSTYNYADAEGAGTAHSAKCVLSASVKG